MAEHVPSRILTVPIRRFGIRASVTEPDLLAVEEPLQIRVGEHNLAVTMRTPGNDAELAAGFLFTEGFVQSSSDIIDIKCSSNTVCITLAEGVHVDPDRSERNFSITSSCGVCGKASMDALKTAGATVIPPSALKVKESLIRSLPAKLRENQTIFERTGGLHACGLFCAEGRMIILREDVGRHNALDKLIGRALLDGHLPLGHYGLMVSGRTSFELVQKAVMAGIPILVAVGAPSSLAVKTALRFGMTLVGFLRDDRFNAYSGASRIYQTKR